MFEIYIITLLPCLILIFTCAEDSTDAFLMVLFSVIATAGLAIGDFSTFVDPNRVTFSEYKGNIVLDRVKYIDYTYSEDFDSVQIHYDEHGKPVNNKYEFNNKIVKDLLKANTPHTLEKVEYGTFGLNDRLIIITFGESSYILDDYLNYK